MDQVLLRLPAVREMVESCRVVFAKAPKGGDGQIAVADFAASAEDLQLKLPAETLQQVLAAADVDGDHKISFKARRALSRIVCCGARTCTVLLTRRGTRARGAQEFTVLLVLCWLLRVRARRRARPLCALRRTTNPAALFVRSPRRRRRAAFRGWTAR